MPVYAILAFNYSTRQTRSSEEREIAAKNRDTRTNRSPNPANSFCVSIFFIFFFYIYYLTISCEARVWTVIDPEFTKFIRQMMIYASGSRGSNHFGSALNLLVARRNHAESDSDTETAYCDYDYW